MSASIVTSHKEPASLLRVRQRHPWRWVSAIVLVAIFAFVLRSVIGNSNLDWPIVGRYLFNRSILSGVVVTAELTIIAQAIGICLGGVLAVGRLTINPVGRAVASAYLWVFRGTPVLVQLIFWYNLALLFPHVGIGLPFTAVGVSVKTNSVITGFTAAILGLGLNEAAYEAEIIRAGVSAVDPGQREAALALGMRQRQVLAKVVLPQAVRTILPPTGNQIISMLKTTSLVAFIAGGDLLTRTENIYSTNFDVIPLLIVASIWYLGMTTILSVAQRLLEKRVGRSLAPQVTKVSAESGIGLVEIPADGR